MLYNTQTHQHYNRTKPTAVCFAVSNDENSVSVSHFLDSCFVVFIVLVAHADTIAGQLLCANITCTANTHLHWHIYINYEIATFCLFNLNWTELICFARCTRCCLWLGVWAMELLVCLSNVRRVFFFWSNKQQYLILMMAGKCPAERMAHCSTLQHIKLISC